jgi:hypothetical protein
MNIAQAQKLLESAILVTPQQVTIAKGYIINHFNRDTSRVIIDFLKSVEAALPEKLVIHLTVGT